MRFATMTRPAKTAPEGLRWGLIKVSEEVITTHKGDPFGNSPEAFHGKTVVMKKGTIARWAWVLKECE